MSQQHCHFEASRCLTALEQDSTIIAVIEMSQSKWLVAALVPGVKRHPLKKLDADEEGLLKLLHRWRHEAKSLRARAMLAPPRPTSKSSTNCAMRCAMPRMPIGPGKSIFRARSPPRLCSMPRANSTKR